MGRKAYTKTIRMAGTVPMPRKQTARDSRAMEGMDCMTLAMPMTILAAVWLRVIRMPSGTPMAREMSRASVVMLMWRKSSVTSSGQRGTRSSQKEDRENEMPIITHPPVRRAQPARR